MIATASTTFVGLPRRWRWLMRGFRRYVHRYLRKHFHAVRLSNSSRDVPKGGEPILVVLNHPSWWDPLIGVVLTEQFGNRGGRDAEFSRRSGPLRGLRAAANLPTLDEKLGSPDHFAAIDAVAVKRYAVFQRLGFVGVDTKSLRGAAEFLRIGKSILSHSNCIFWVTAQGRFTDVRERPLKLQSGVGHLAARLERGLVVPLALEYAFWNERTPEALARFGEPIAIPEHRGLDGKQWMKVIEGALTHNLDELNAEAMTRDRAKFRVLLHGRTGIGGIYDRWRGLAAWLRGKRFDPSHEATMRGRHDA
jgi:1-acyl-sn-glycerol-3-phosphate acyltransferase